MTTSVAYGCSVRTTAHSNGWTWGRGGADAPPRFVLRDVSEKNREGKRTARERLAAGARERRRRRRSAAAHWSWAERSSACSAWPPVDRRARRERRQGQGRGHRGPGASPPRGPRQGRASPSRWARRTRQVHAHGVGGLPLPGLQGLSRTPTARRSTSWSRRRTAQGRVPPRHPHRRQHGRQRLPARGQRRGLRPGRREVHRVPRRAVREPARGDGRRLRREQQADRAGRQGRGADTAPLHAVRARTAPTTSWVAKSDEAFRTGGFSGTPTVLLNGKNIYRRRTRRT